MDEQRINKILKAERKREWKKQLKLFPGYVPMILWLIFFATTIGWIFAASFSSTREIFTGKVLATGAHFDNYIKAWVNNNVARYFLNSLITSSISCTVIIFISAPAAYILGHKIFPGRKFLTNSFLFAMSVPTVMIVIPIFATLIRINMVGRLETLIVLYIAANVPYSVYFLTCFFSTVPQALEEAALIDGCSNSRAFWKIMLPMATPGIVTVTIFNFINTWNEYFMALIFANSSSETRTLAVGLQNMIDSMRFTGDWAGLFASVIIVFLPTLIMYLFLSEKIIAGVTGGAVKG